MFGGKGRIVEDMRDLILKADPDDVKDNDQLFLAEHVLPRIKNSVFIHDEFCRSSNYNIGAKPFPVKRNGYGFVGEIYDENDKVAVYGRTAMIERYSWERGKPVIKIKRIVKQWLTRHRLGAVIVRLLNLK
jgi:hypothetical protein